MRNWIRPLLLLVLLSLSGCYYMQAAGGQMEVLRKREPIDEVINNPDTPPDVAERLQLVAEARRFSIEHLGLPDNDSYATYSDLERDYVVWNVFAAGEFSLRPETWCYPVVAAYSTLGKFDDPVLNTMMRWDDTQLVGVLFHELAHQVLYIKGDTGFNESFATAVEEFGVERFLESTGRAEQFGKYEARKDFRRKFMAVIESGRADLEALYERDLPDEQKRSLKDERMAKLAADIRREIEAYGGNADAWFRYPLNNARLVSLSLYEGLLPQFRQMLANCEGDLECFYAEARRVSALDPGARQAAMDALL